MVGESVTSVDDGLDGTCPRSGALTVAPLAVVPEQVLVRDHPGRAVQRVRYKAPGFRIGAREGTVPSCHACEPRATHASNLE